jgi:hypothetical protein
MDLTRWIWYQDGLQGTVLAPKVPGSNDVGVYVLLHHSMSRGNLFCGFCTWPLGWLSKHHAPRTAPLIWTSPICKDSKLLRIELRLLAYIRLLNGKI